MDSSRKCGKAWLLCGRNVPNTVSQSSHQSNMSESKKSGASMKSTGSRLSRLPVSNRMGQESSSSVTSKLSKASTHSKHGSDLQTKGRVSNASVHSGILHHSAENPINEEIPVYTIGVQQEDTERGLQSAAQEREISEEIEIKSSSMSHGGTDIGSHHASANKTPWRKPSKGMSSKSLVPSATSRRSTATANFDESQVYTVTEETGSGFPAAASNQTASRRSSVTSQLKDRSSKSSGAARRSTADAILDEAGISQDTQVFAVTEDAKSGGFPAAGSYQTASRRSSVTSQLKNRSSKSSGAARRSTADAILDEAGISQDTQVFAVTEDAKSGGFPAARSNQTASRRSSVASQLKDRSSKSSGAARRSTADAILDEAGISQDTQVFAVTEDAKSGGFPANASTASDQPSVTNQSKGRPSSSSGASSDPSAMAAIDEIAKQQDTQVYTANEEVEGGFPALSSNQTTSKKSSASGKHSRLSSIFASREVAVYQAEAGEEGEGEESKPEDKGNKDDSGGASSVNDRMAALLDWLLPKLDSIVGPRLDEATLEMITTLSQFAKKGGDDKEGKKE